MVVYIDSKKNNIKKNFRLKMEDSSSSSGEDDSMYGNRGSGGSGGGHATRPRRRPKYRVT